MMIDEAREVRGNDRECIREEAARVSAVPVREVPAPSPEHAGRHEDGGDEDDGELRIADDGPDRGEQGSRTFHQALRSGISSLSSRRIWSFSRSLRFLRRRSCSSST